MKVGCLPAADEGEGEERAEIRAMLAHRRDDGDSPKNRTAKAIVQSGPVARTAMRSKAEVTESVITAQPRVPVRPGEQQSMACPLISETLKNL
jgi:hypothetical protein